MIGTVYLPQLDNFYLNIFLLHQSKTNKVIDYRDASAYRNLVEIIFPCILVDRQDYGQGNLAL